MKNFFISVLLLAGTSYCVTGQNADWSWVSHSNYNGGAGGGKCIATGSDGSIYMAGDFASPTITFDTVILPNNSGNLNLSPCLVKYNASGDVIWARTTGSGYHSCSPHSIATDRFGNAYLAGYFDGDSIIFGTITLTNPFSTGLHHNLFLVKFDSTGNAVWAKCASSNNSSGYCWANAVETDSAGNVYLAGFYTGPHIYIDNHLFTNTDQITFPGADMFIIRFDSSGNTDWGLNLGGMQDDMINDIAIKGDHLYVTGEFASDTIFFPSTYITSGSLGMNNVFAIKARLDGTIDWVYHNPTPETSKGIAIDASSDGRVYLAGNFESYKIIFGNDTLDNHSGPFHYNVFSVILDSTGVPVHAKSPDQHHNALVYGMAVDEDDNFYITGRFNHGNIGFDSILLFNSYQGYEEIFVAKYDTGLTIEWAKSAGGKANDFGTGITAAGGNVYVTGMYCSDTIHFGNILITGDTGSWATDEIYVAKIGESCAAVSIVQQPSDQLKHIGETASFHVSTIGSLPFQYQWFQNGILMNNDTSASLSVSNVTLLDDGNTYRCRITNCNNSSYIDSRDALLKVCEESFIVIEPALQLLSVGDTAIFIAHVSGGYPVTYQWYRNNIPIPGETDSILIIPSVGTSENGSVFDCRITSCFGIDHSQSGPATLQVNGFEIYPNPVYDLLHINYLNIIRKLKIYDVVGQLVYETNHATAEIPFETPRCGIYFVVVYTDEYTIVNKIVKAE